MASKSYDQLVSELKKRVSFPLLFKELFPENFRDRGSCRCPSPGHEDKNPSFQCEDNHGYCHSRQCRPPAGGTTNEDTTRWSPIDLWMVAHNVDFNTAVRQMAARVGLSTVDPKPHKTSAKPEAIYPYHDENDSPLYQVLRYPGTEPGKKSFRQRRPHPEKPGQWLWNLKDFRRVLFHLPQLLAADPKKPVLIVEGEKDVLAAEKIGFTATCNPQGAGNWKPLCEQWEIHEPLKDRVCWVIPDNDEIGGKHAQEVAETLVNHARSVKVVALPVPEKGDLTDFIGEVGEEKAPQWIHELADDSPEFAPPKPWGETTLNDIIRSDDPPPRMIVPGLLVEGLSILAGRPKIGKSFLGMNLCLALAERRPAVGHFPCKPKEVLALLLEDSKPRVKKRAMLYLGEDLCQGNLYVEIEAPRLTEKENEPSLLDFLHSWLMRHSDAAMILIDTLIKVKPRGNSKDNMYLEDYKTLEPLQRLAINHHIAIVVIHHESKRETTDVLDSISGSTGLTGAADQVLSLKRDRRSSGATLTVTARDLETFQITLTFDGERGAWRYEGDPRQINLSAAAREILKIMEEAEGKPMTPTQIGDQCKPKKTKHNVSNILNRLAEDGWVERSVLPGKWILSPNPGPESVTEREESPEKDEDVNLESI